ncbi:thioesterase II family protein [Pseudoduganella chitinolytica]|uniref:Alpha/beta fold hydrolase n=1 Tax=Pseudoduganella chitinolytica TaxID=34070 RepID=A0ABY8BAH4_9BURK|nr:alpha/beta fold hydrolase [Pseudoduganella chitinolytica]WEF32910.1 alpha/beta fold hydrolase [Pseudoduganella chitinolytica]
MTNLKWFNPPRHNPAARVNLLCFHHAGGAASFYKKWPAALSPLVQVLPVQMPGRETRYDEAFAPSIGAMVDELLRHQHAFADKPYALFGHSLGALFGFELGRRLARVGAAAPRFLVASGHGAPRAEPAVEQLHGLPDRQFVDRMREKYGGISDEVMASEELLDFLLPRFRADIRIAEQHVSQDDTPVRFPVVALHGRADQSVSMADVQGWQDKTAARVSIHEFDGDHFFIETNERQVIGVVNKLLGDQLRSLEA